MRVIFLPGLALYSFLTLMTAIPCQAAELTVSAAASLTNAFAEVKDAFIKKTGIAVTTNFAASNPLLRQIQEGAPVDVFASADQATMDKAAQGKLIDEATRVNFALNDLVLIVPAANSVAVASPGDLTKEAVKRIAVGNPESVPAGRYARDSLTAGKLWEVLQPKYIMGENVRQVLDYVSRGEVEAGIVYMTDARQAGDKVKIAAVLSGHEPVSYPIAVIKSSKSPREARAFIEFVRGDEGATILKKYGFVKP